MLHNILAAITNTEAKFLPSVIKPVVGEFVRVELASKQNWENLNGSDQNFDVDRGKLSNIFNIGLARVHKAPMIY